MNSRSGEGLSRPQIGGRAPKFNSLRPSEQGLYMDRAKARTDIRLSDRFCSAENLSLGRNGLRGPNILKTQQLGTMVIPLSGKCEIQPRVGTESYAKELEQMIAC